MAISRHYVWSKGTEVTLLCKFNTTAINIEMASISVVCAGAYVNGTVKARQQEHEYCINYITCLQKQANSINNSYYYILVY